MSVDALLAEPGFDEADLETLKQFMEGNVQKDMALVQHSGHLSSEDAEVDPDAAGWL